MKRSNEEIRSVDFTATSTGADGRTLEGYAAVYDQPAEIDSPQEGRFTETIQRGAFGASIARQSAGAAVRSRPASSDRRHAARQDHRHFRRFPRPARAAHDSPAAARRAREGRDCRWQHRRYERPYERCS